MPPADIGASSVGVSLVSYQRCETLDLATGRMTSGASLISSNQKPALIPNPTNGFLGIGNRSNSIEFTRAVAIDVAIAVRTPSLVRASSVRFECRLAEVERELLAFPSSKYKDQVDALSQLLPWTRDRPKIVSAMPDRYVTESNWIQSGSPFSAG
jgi:hypothetical protein